MKLVNQNKRIIYMDHAATTPLAPGVLEAMLPYLTDCYGNASTLYDLGKRAKKAVDDARRKLAGMLGAAPSEIYFTSGGTESDNWALVKTAEKLSEKGRHIITTRVEHHAVLNTCKYLESRGFSVTYLDVNDAGRVSPEAVEAAIRPDTILISVMTANNEVGTIQPVHQIGILARQKGILFHTDAVQAFGHLPVNVNDDCIDMLSASAHKVGGPKGVGLLYMRRGVKLKALLNGGQQEKGRRAGTENVAGIVGFAQAAVYTSEAFRTGNEAVKGMRDRLIRRILSEIPDTFLNGDIDYRLTNNVNISFDFIDGEQLLYVLGAKGICCSAGAACASGAVEASHVLLSMGVPYERALGTLRFSLGCENTMDEIDLVIDELKKAVGQLRSRSALYRQQ